MKKRKINIRGLTVELKKGFAIKQDVDIVFNSANGFLLMRTGTAKSIRENSKELNKKESRDYFRILREIKNKAMRRYVDSFNVEKWLPRQAQFSCLRKIQKNKGPYKKGEIVIDKGSEINKDILHIVGMTYRLEKNGKLYVDGVKENFLKRVLKKSFRFADKRKYGSVALPVLCTRGTYGLSPRQSLKAIIGSLKETPAKNIKKVIICFESEGPKRLFNQIINKT